MKKAWLYDRDSVNDKLPASRLEKFQRYAKENQIEIVGISFDNCGWENLDREGLNRAILAINDKEADVILVPTLNRITRSIAGTKAFAELIGEHDRLLIMDTDDAVAWNAMKGERIDTAAYGLRFGTI